MEEADVMLIDTVDTMNMLIIESRSPVTGSTAVSRGQAFARSLAHTIHHCPVKGQLNTHRSILMSVQLGPTAWTLSRKTDGNKISRSARAAGTGVARVNCLARPPCISFPVSIYSTDLSGHHIG